MIFQELFYENNQPANPLLYIRQAGEVLKDRLYSISRCESPTHVLGFLKSGCLQIALPEKQLLLQPGQSVFLPRDLAYTLTADVTDPPNFVWFNVRGKLIDSIAATVANGSPLFSSAAGGQDFLKLKALLVEAQNRTSEIGGLILKILLQLKETETAPVVQQAQPSKYEAYISNCLQGTFSVHKMAQHFHCSTDTVNRIFLKEYGTTPYRYYQNMRIGIAGSLLRETTLTVEDIAERLHFSDRNYFSLYFKRATGQTPVQFRKNGGQLPQNSTPKKR